MSFNTLVAVKEKMQDDISLRNNTMVQNIFENFNTKSGRMSQYDQMVFLKTQLENVNSYLKSETLNEALNDLEIGMNELIAKHPTIISSKKANAFGLKEKLVHLRESSAYVDPTFKVYVENLLESKSDIPEFYYFNDVLQVLSRVNEHAEASALSNELKQYIDTNKKTLLLLETIDQLKTVPKIYDGTIQLLNEMVASGDISSSRLEMRLDPFGKKSGIVTGAMQLLKNWEGSPANIFNLGKGDVDVIVESFIGPAVKDNTGLLFYADKAYYKITKDAINENTDEVRHILGSSGDYTLYEVNAHHIYNTNRKFYNLVESFNSLGFKFNGNKITSSLRQLPIDIALNENETLDLLIDGRKVEKINEVKFEEMFTLETSNKKKDAINVLQNSDNIFNVDFIKFIMNENKSSMVVNIDNDYYVYDRLNESRVNVFKMGGYQLFKHLKQRFGYDTRNIFDVAINESMSRYNELASTQTEVKQYIEQLEKIHEALVSAQGKIQDDELKGDVQNFATQVEDAIGGFKDQYIEVGDEMDALNDQPEMVSKYYGTGDQVNIQPENVNGRIVAANNDNDTYSVATDSGDLMDVPGNRLMLIQVQILPDGEPGEVNTTMIDDDTPMGGQMGTQMPINPVQSPVPTPIQPMSVPGAQPAVPPVQGDVVSFDLPLEESEGVSDDVGSQAVSDDAGSQAVSDEGGTGNTENVNQSQEIGDATAQVQNVSQNVTSVDQVPALAQGNTLKNTPAKDVAANPPTQIDISESNTNDADVKKNFNLSQSQNVDNDVFTPHGSYTVSNSGGYEVELSKDGGSARVRDAYGSDDPQVSEWFEIQYVPAQEGQELQPVIDPTGYNIPLNQVMRINNRVSQNVQGTGNRNNTLDSGGPETANNMTDRDISEDIDLSPEQLKQWSELMSIPDKNNKLEALMRRVNALKLEESDITTKANGYVEKLQKAIEELRTQIKGSPDGPDDVTYDATQIPGIVNENERIDFYEGDKKQIKIIKCSNYLAWYKNLIGEEFTVIDDKKQKWDDRKEKWKVVPTEDKKEILGSDWHSVLYILKEDCEEIGSVNENLSFDQQMVAAILKR